MGKRTRHGRPQRSRRPEGAWFAAEALEPRALLAAGVIGGHVYHDSDGDGLNDPGEAPVAGVPIRLLNASGVVVGTATTDASGAYRFSRDETIPLTSTTSAQSASFPESSTNFTKTATAPKFDPSLGKLTSVDVTLAGTLTSHIQEESRDPTPTTIVGTVAGTLAVDGPAATDLAIQPTTTLTFAASAYDGSSDFAGTSGKDFGPVSADGSKTITLTDPDSLAPFMGIGTVPFTLTASSSSSASGPGNLLGQIASKASANVGLAYHYLPVANLKPGAYTIVQADSPPGFVAGLNSRGGTTLPRGAAGTNAIPVTFTGSDTTDNDFGQWRPNSLSGSVYLDADGDGRKEFSEFGIANVVVTLAGRDEANQTVQRSATTDASGGYRFDDLRPGEYTITETQPQFFATGTDSIGTQGGQAGTNRFSKVVLRPDVQGVGNNFGERRLPNCNLSLILSRVSRNEPLPATLGPNIQRYLPGIVEYAAQHPHRKSPN